MEGREVVRKLLKNTTHLCHFIRSTFDIGKLRR